MLDIAIQSAIKVSLITDEKSLPKLEKYLEVNYSGWRYIGEAFPWAYMTIAAIVLPQAEWTDEDTDVFDELQQERLLCSYDWSYATEQELALRTPGQVIPALLGALTGLVGSDGYLTQSGTCVCNEIHRRNNTICCSCKSKGGYRLDRNDRKVAKAEKARSRALERSFCGTLQARRSGRSGLCERASGANACGSAAW